MRRSRLALAGRGGKLVQVRLDANARRSVAAIALLSDAANASDALARAAAEWAMRERFPLRLSREQETELARLAIGPWTVERFRATGHADAFLAGLAIALAGDRDVPRARLLAIARELQPGMVDERGYRRWLDATPITLPRLFKLVRAERAVTKARDGGQDRRALSRAGALAP